MRWKGPKALTPTSGPLGDPDARSGVARSTFSRPRPCRWPSPHTYTQAVHQAERRVTTSTRRRHPCRRRGSRGSLPGRAKGERNRHGVAPTTDGSVGLTCEVFGALIARVRDRRVRCRGSSPGSRLPARMLYLCRTVPASRMSLPASPIRDASSPARSIDREQAHLSTEQPPACPHARFPVADADPCRSHHPGRPPPQGPRQARCLTRPPINRPTHPASMLPASVRLRRRVVFDAVVRRGQRCGHGPLAVHVQVGMPCTSVGFIVSRAVGNSVTRHRVTRQLRHLMRERYRSLPAGTGVVVRALPAAGGRSSADLGNSLDRALERALVRGRAGSTSRTASSAPASS